MADHVNIVRYYGFFDITNEDEDSDAEDKDEAKIGLVMEVAQGSLKDLVQIDKDVLRCLNIEEAAYLARQMVSGVAYLHAQKIIHR